MVQTGEPASCWRCDEGFCGSRFLAMHQRHGHDQATPMSAVPGALVANISPPQLKPNPARYSPRNFSHRTIHSWRQFLTFATIQYCLRHTFTSLQSSPTLISRTDQATAYQHHHQVHDFLTQTKVPRDVARHSNRLIPTFHSALTFPLSASHSASQRHRYRDSGPPQPNTNRPDRDSISHDNFALDHWGCKTLLLAFRRCPNKTAWPR